MDLCWSLEYIKVFSGYIFLMFIWPMTVFWNYLKNKGKIFRFCFCVVVQICIINTSILMLGLFNILNKALVSGLFYGVFVSVIIYRNRNILRNRAMCKESLKAFIWVRVRGLWHDLRPQIIEYMVLFLVITYGMIYFSYGAFQIYSYGQYDIPIHHMWVNELVKGNVFPEGIYPQAMHCFIYSLSTIFNIRVYSIMLFLQGIHVAVFLISAYCLLKEVFQWRYTPILILGLYLTMDFNFKWSMTRLQQTLPLEFGLYTQFLCAMYLIRYLKKAGGTGSPKKLSKDCWDENLLLFMLSLAASISIHYHTTIMAFILCASFALFNIRKIVCVRHLIPLVSAILCGCIIALVPVIGGAVSGIPFEGSIDWGLNSIIKSGSSEDEGGDGAEAGKAERAFMELKTEELEMLEKLSPLGQRIVYNIIRTEYLVRESCQKGYLGMYGAERGNIILRMTLIIIVVCLICKKLGGEYIKTLIKGYPPLILISFLSAVIFAAYNAPELGLIVLIPNQRFASSGHMIVLAVMMIPVDLLFSVAMCFLADKMLQILSVISLVGIYIGTNIFGIYHEYLYCVLTRYNSDVLVVNSIIEEYEPGSYTIVSPYEDRCQVELYGRHEELSTFFESVEKENYSLSTEYVFMFVEKRPIGFRQVYYFNGPAWLAKSRDSVIKADKISPEAAKQDWRATEDEWWSRTILESKAYEWCQKFAELYPSELHIYYEDEDLLCYYFKQDTEQPYNLAIE